MSVAAARMDELFQGVVAPLALGGDLTPPRPVGVALAEQMGDLADVFSPSDDALARAAFDRRARRARALWPLDDLPPLSAAEWRMTAALSDLVQAINPRLAGLFGGARPLRLLASIEATLAAVPAVRTAADALARHATFARLPELERLDATVRWWTGSAHFVGESPPPRLLAWPRARRVSVREQRVPLPELAGHLASVQARWLSALALFLAKTPLTDLAWRRRGDPLSRSTNELARLSATAAGRALVARVRRAASGPGVAGEPGSGMF